MLPLIALIGRPNVGKSTLFNRLVGKQLAIVHDEPGVTRDRHYADAAFRGRPVTWIDTGGFDPQDEDPMRQGIARHVAAAIAEADVIVCVLDARGLPTEADRQAVQMLRKAQRPLVFFANRADNPEQEMAAGDLYRLGIDELIIGSALHGRNISALETAIAAQLPEAPPDPVPEAASESADSEPADKVPRIALLGRPNAGKSSFLNLVSGTERALVDDRPGTTRDTIDARITFRGKGYTIIDTAGVRRKAKVEEAVESASVMRSLRAMATADVVLLLCDAKEGLAEQDAKLLALATDRGRPIVVALNKTDLLSSRERTDAIQAAKDGLHFAPWVPVLGLSVMRRTGLRRVMTEIDKVFSEFTHRVGTAELNRFLAEVIERTPPPAKAGRSPRIYYITQAQSAPPVFVAMCSNPKALPTSYRRFVQNQLRTALGFDSIPIVIRFRERRRDARGKGR